MKLFFIYIQLDCIHKEVLVYKGDHWSILISNLFVYVNIMFHFIFKPPACNRFRFLALHSKKFGHLWYKVVKLISICQWSIFALLSFLVWASISVYPSVWIPDRWDRRVTEHLWALHITRLCFPLWLISKMWKVSLHNRFICFQTLNQD